MSATTAARGRAFGTRQRPQLAAALRLLGVLAGALLGGGLVLALFGHDSLAAGRAMAQAAFGSSYQIATTLNRAAPYLLAATGVALCCRAGLLNLGGEGQIALGGLAVALVMLPEGQGARSQLVALAAAMAAGAIWSGLAGVMLAVQRVPVVLGTLLLNVIGLLLVGWVLRGRLGGADSEPARSAMFATKAWLPKLNLDSDLHIGSAIALVVALAVQLVLRGSVAGLHWQLLGQAPRAARLAGVSPGLQQVVVMALGGGLAGLAGGIEVLGVQYQLTEGFSAGFGLTAVAVALVAAASPLTAIPVALCFAGLETGAAALEQEAGIPAGLAQVVEALAVLFALAAQGLRR
jgi:simple sugar transport system permease protein